MLDVAGAFEAIIARWRTSGPVAVKRS